MSGVEPTLVSFGKASTSYSSKALIHGSSMLHILRCFYCAIVELRWDCHSMAIDQVHGDIFWLRCLSVVAFSAVIVWLGIFSFLAFSHCRSAKPGDFTGLPHIFASTVVKLAKLARFCFSGHRSWLSDALFLRYCVGHISVLFCLIF